MIEKIGKKEYVLVLLGRTYTFQNQRFTILRYLGNNRIPLQYQNL